MLTVAVSTTNSAGSEDKEPSVWFMHSSETDFDLDCQTAELRLALSDRFNRISSTSVVRLQESDVRNIFTRDATELWKRSAADPPTDLDPNTMTSQWKKWAAITLYPCVCVWVKQRIYSLVSCRNKGRLFDTQRGERRGVSRNHAAPNIS